MNSDEHEIRELVSTWSQATQAHEWNKILELMDADAVFLAAGRPALQGRKTFAMALETMAEYTIQTTSNIQEIKISGDMAYCWNHLSLVLQPNQGRNTIKKAGNVLSILEKKAGKWLITRDANMLNPIEY